MKKLARKAIFNVRGMVFGMREGYKFTSSGKGSPTLAILDVTKRWVLKAVEEGNEDLLPIPASQSLPILEKAINDVSVFSF